MRLRLLTTASKQLSLGNRQRHRLLATSASGQHQQEHQEYQPGGSRALYAAAAVGGIGAGYWLFHELNKKRRQPVELAQPQKATSSPVALDVEEAARLWHKTKRTDLPTYSTEDVLKHDKPDTGIWVTYGIGVYDVTEFAPNHPGGDKIMMAAGNAIDPFWAIYQQHNTLDVLELLESFRIGNLYKVEAIENDELGSPWAQEPKRHELLKPASKRPFNAEPPISMLGEHFYTPNELFYVRNHLPVPCISAEDYELELEVEAGAGKSSKCTFNLDEIKKLPKHTVTAAIMCGGNRRSEMTRIKPVKGEPPCGLAHPDLIGSNLISALQASPGVLEPWAMPNGRAPASAMCCVLRAWSPMSTCRSYSKALTWIRRHIPMGLRYLCPRH